MRPRRADVLRAARDLIDNEGLDGLTIAALAAAMGVPPDGLPYPSRQALLEGVADELLSALAEPPPAGPWDQRLITLAHRLRRALLSLRDGPRLVAEAAVTDPETMHAARTGMQILVDAGLPPDRAAWTVLAVIQFVVGHTIEEQAPRDDTPAKLAATTGDDAAVELGAALTADPGRRFEFGLALIVDGIRRLFQSPA